MSPGWIAAGAVLGLLVHEAGHFVAIRLSGRAATPVLTRRGPGIRWDHAGSSPWTRAGVSAAGIVANLLLVAVAWRTGLAEVALTSADLAFTNLVWPTRHADGRKALAGVREGLRAGFFDGNAVHGESRA